MTVKHSTIDIKKRLIVDDKNKKPEKRRNKKINKFSVELKNEYEIMAKKIEDLHPQVFVNT